jgi:hypothetical protein
VSRRDKLYQKLDDLEKGLICAFRREFNKEIQGERSFFLYSLLNRKKYPHEHQIIQDSHLDRLMKDIVELRRSLHEEEQQGAVLAIVNEYVNMMIEGNFFRNRTLCRNAIKKLDEILKMS